MAVNEIIMQSHLITQRLSSVVVAALNQNEQIIAEFKNSVFPYKRSDLSSRIMPAINVYVSSTSSDSVFGFFKGNLAIDLYLPLKDQREIQSIKLGLYSDLVTSMLKWGIETQGYISEQLPYMTELGFSHSFAFIDGQQLVDNNEALYAMGNFSFTLDIERYITWLNNQGFTIDDLSNETIQTIEQLIANLEVSYDGIN